MIFSVLKAERDSDEEKEKSTNCPYYGRMQVLHKSRWCKKGWMVNGSFINGKRSANQGFFVVFFTFFSRISISSKLEITVFVSTFAQWIHSRRRAKKWFSFIKNRFKSTKYSKWKHVFLVCFEYEFQLYYLYRFQYSMRIKQVVDTQLDI